MMITPNVPAAMAIHVTLLTCSLRIYVLASAKNNGLIVTSTEALATLV
jgi:hypothetical protein